MLQLFPGGHLRGLLCGECEEQVADNGVRFKSFPGNTTVQLQSHRRLEQRAGWGFFPPFPPSVTLKTDVESSLNLHQPHPTAPERCRAQCFLPYCVTFVA